MVICLLKFRSCLKVATAILSIIYFSLFIFSSSVLASTSSYIYDDLGRLSRVIDDQGNVATYNYDEVGNLISITKSTTAQLLPQISSISPDFVRAGSTVNLTIAGSNLLGSSLTTDNPGIEIIDTKITDTAMAATFSVSQTARQGTTVVTVTNPIGSASINISVYPPSPVPTISPSVKVVQPNGGTGTMTIALTNPDIFPTTITLNIADPSIATVNIAQVIIPAGETQATITITGNTPGLTTITASTGTGSASATINTAGPLVGANFVYSNQVGIILKTPPIPPKLVAREPILSPMVGVSLEAPPPPSSSKTFGPVQTPPVGIAFGPTITSISPNRGAIGSSNLEITINGADLGGTTSVAFQPNTGITINGAPSVSPDGSSVTVSVSIALTAPQVARTVAVATPSGLARPASIGANIFTVTPPPPEIFSIIPIQAQVGTIFTLSINGKNLTGATSIDFVPNTGIVVGNPPSINSAGTQATVNIAIAVDAPVGQRGVTITTGGGTTTDLASAANTFTITSSPGTSFTPLLSPEVGVDVEKSPSSTSTTFGPVKADLVGIAFGPTITSISPNKGVIGADSLTVTINGANLEGASSVSFQPNTGITINGSPVAAADGNSVSITISIALDAPRTQRRVAVNTSSGLARPSAPFADIFTVTLPPPEIISIIPITGSIGTSLTLTVNGKDLTEATSIAFIPDTGISVGNPPSVSTDGKSATASVSIAANAPTGYRVVAITTPGGTTTDIASAANTFTVVTIPGTTMSPLLSPLVGVTIQTTPQPAISNTFSPVISPGIGVELEKTPPPSTPVTISPILAPSVGVALGSAITGIAPKAGAPGTTNMTLTIRGANLNSATGVSIFPSTGITIAGMVVATDGSSIDVPISIAADAALGPRTIAVNTPSGKVSPSVPEANIFQISTLPEIFSIIPIQQTVGATFTLTINGINLKGATQVSFIPADGISVGNPPSVNADGTLATVQVSISTLAAPGQRVVTISTPSSTSSATATSANSLTVIGIVTSFIPLHPDSPDPSISEDRSISPPAYNDIVSFGLPSAGQSNGDHREAEGFMPYPIGLPAAPVTPRLGPITPMRGILNNTISGHRETSADIKQGGSYKTAIHNNHSYAIKDDALKAIRLISLIRSQRPRSPTGTLF